MASVVWPGKENLNQTGPKNLFPRTFGLGVSSVRRKNAQVYLGCVSCYIQEEGRSQCFQKEENGHGKKKWGWRWGVKRVRETPDKIGFLRHPIFL